MFARISSIENHMEQRIVKLKRGLLMAGDAAILYASLWIAVALRGVVAGGGAVRFQ